MSAFIPLFFKNVSVYTPIYFQDEDVVKAVSESAAQVVVEHTLGDLLYHVEDRLNTDT